MCRRRHGVDDFFEVDERQPFFQNKGRGEVKRPGAADRHVVHGSRNGKSPDVAPGKKEGVHDMCVTGRNEPSCKGRHHGAVVPLLKVRIFKRRGKEFLNQLGGGAASGPHRHIDETVSDIKRSDVVGFYAHGGSFMRDGVVRRRRRQHRRLRTRPCRRRWDGWACRRCRRRGSLWVPFHLGESRRIRRLCFQRRHVP